MLFKYSNMKDIEQLGVHDCVFSGFSYDYENRKVDFVLVDPIARIDHVFCFENVIFIDLQSCSFWHGGCNVIDMYVNELPLAQERYWKDEAGKHDWYIGSQLGKGIAYISVGLQLNSGDTLDIISETLCYSKIGDS